jgi:hypothetical protein
MNQAEEVYKKFLDAKGNAILVNCAVLYIDVLGTAQHSVAPNREDLLRKLLNALEVAREEAMVESNEPWQALAWFTDNVVAAFPIMPGHIDEEPALGSALRAATFIQLRLAVSGFLARGGISFGEIHMAPHVAFGPALIEAVELEGRAVTPRVILSADAVAHQREAMLSYTDQAPQEIEMAIDHDGEVFVDYLNFWRDEEDDRSVMEHFLEQHRIKIEDGLAASTPNSRVYAKYEWLARYHNWVMSGWPDGAAFAVQGQPTGHFRRAVRESI